MSNLRFSAPDWCFFSENSNPADYYARLKDLGCIAVEMVPQERRRFAREAGLKVLNISAPGMASGLNNRKEHPAIIKDICKAIDEAAEYDIPHVIIFSGNIVEGNTDGVGACAEAIAQLLPYAEEKGRILTFEMLNSYDHPGYEASSSEYGLKLARHFSSPNFKVLLDLYHMHMMGENPAALIKDNIEHIAHLHVAGSPARDFPGEAQEVNYKECMRAALKCGYDGYWGMEFKPEEDRLNGLREALMLFQSHARSVLSEQ